MEFALSDVVTGLVGLGLVAKGILDRAAKSSTPAPQHCAMAQERTEALIKKLDTVATACDKSHDALIRILTILEERK